MLIVSLGVALLRCSVAQIVTIPSWANEKAPGVSARATMYSALAVGTGYYVLIGVCGAAALTVAAGTAILAVLSSPPTGLAARIATYVWRV